MLFWQRSRIELFYISILKRTILFYLAPFRLGCTRTRLLRYYTGLQILVEWLDFLPQKRVLGPSAHKLWEMPRLGRHLLGRRRPTSREQQKERQKTLLKLCWVHATRMFSRLLTVWQWVTTVKVRTYRLRAETPTCFKHHFRIHVVWSFVLM